MAANPLPAKLAELDRAISRNRDILNIGDFFQRKMYEMKQQEIGTIRELLNESKQFADQMKAHADFDTRQIGWKLAANLDAINNLLKSK